jgi:hypothetical protein
MVTQNIDMAPPKGVRAACERGLALRLAAAMERRLAH